MNTLRPLWEDDDAVSGRAAAYFAKRRFGEWSEADQSEFDAWLGASALHEAAYLRVEGIAANTKELLALRQPKPAATAVADERKPQYRRFTFPLLLAASFALIAVLSFPYVSALLQPADRIDSTDIGGRTLLNFADHTQIELNTNTVMRVRMTTAERTVWLEKGEAWFRVAHNAAHPFNVVVGKHRITDLGTEFVVRRDAGNVQVALLAGRAALSGGPQTAVLAPGDEATATIASLSVTHKTPQALADELAWRRGMLVFRRTKLADVVRQFNRYNTTKLVIADPSIADEPFTADLKTDDYEDFLNLAQSVLNLRVEREGNDILISRSRKSELRNRKSEAKLRAEDRP